MEITQKQIEIEAQNYLNSLDLPENADKQLIVDNFKNGMTWAMMLIKEEKQQWIMKAKEWLHDNAKNYIDYTEEGEIAFSENDMVINFKKDMVEQL